VPELPEVETIRRGLEGSVLLITIDGVRVHGRRSIRRQSPQAFIEACDGRTFTSALRRGKYLALCLDDGAFLVVHLAMSGQLLLIEDPLSPLVAHTHVVFSLGDGRELRFVDPRTFGELFVTTSLAGNGLPAALSALGPDPLIDDLSGALLHAMCSQKNTSLKALLLDQRAIAGIGSLYADEICFRAAVRPDRRTNTLNTKECEVLSGALYEVLGAALARGGSSLADEGYRDLFGQLGSYQGEHCVYGREAHGCRRCGTAIARVRVAGRSAHFCPSCQA